MRKNKLGGAAALMYEPPLGYTLQHTTLLLTLRTLNLHLNNYARNFTLIYTLNLSSRTFYNILKKKQEEKSFVMQKFIPNYSKYNCDVASTNFDPLKLRNGEIQCRRQGGARGPRPPIDMLGPPNQQAYSFENSGFVLNFTFWPPLINAWPP